MYMLNASLRHVALVVVFALLLTVPQNSSVGAADLTSRYLRVGSSVPSEVTNYRFGFEIASVANLGSIEFQFCAESPLIGYPCTTPTGFSASGATLASQTGEIGFSIDPASTVNRIILTRPSVLASQIPVTYRFNNITNPSDIGTYYVRIMTYTSIDASGPITDSGGLAFAVNRGLGISTYVPPYLTFCVGVTVAGDCSSANGNQLSFGELNPGQTKAVTSQYAGATNDPGGFSTYINGITMTSGTNTIPALTTPTNSIPGLSQFGMNLRANTQPFIGSNPSGIGSSSPTADYNQPNKYTFKNQMVSDSANSTDFNLFTATYLVNVSQQQKPGIYTTTLTYTAIAAF